MRPSDKLLSDLDEWTARNETAEESRRTESLRDFLSRSFRGIPEELLAGILERWSELRRGPEGSKRARAWLDATCLLLLTDYDDDPSLPQEDWTQIREIFSSEAETLDMNLLSYIMERVLEHGGF